MVSSRAEVSSRFTFGGYFSKPLIASGGRVAFGAPRFAFSGVAVGVEGGVGVSVGDGDGVSLGSGVGEDFFFCFADGEALGDGDADSFFVVDDFFFLCGVGVGVAVEKIFLIFSPTVWPLAGAVEIAKNAAIKRIKAQ